MTDLYDRATEAEELHREMSLRQARNKKRAAFTGYCRYCNESINQAGIQRRNGSFLHDNQKQEDHTRENGDHEV